MAGTTHKHAIKINLIITPKNTNPCPNPEKDGAVLGEAKFIWWERAYEIILEVCYTALPVKLKGALVCCRQGMECYIMSSTQKRHCCNTLRESVTAGREAAYVPVSPPAPCYTALGSACMAAQH
ncbi:hypothetical protein BaRGS_00016394 [Batillaria attramentaria]|uniref:Uncharacterized protein n=1 Tax=Batillaria attramentaria TaxID=370345 RepID=A0ABD0KZU8_9CAEN